MMKLFIAACLSMFMIFPAFAQGKKRYSPAMYEQVVMSEKLIAIGKTRNDPWLILAAIRLRSNLSRNMPSTGPTLTSRAEAYAAAKVAATGNPALVERIEKLQKRLTRPSRSSTKNAGVLGDNEADANNDVCATEVNDADLCF